MAEDLTIEELQAYVDAVVGKDFSATKWWPIRIAEQLIATMQREEKLREALQDIADHGWVTGVTPDNLRKWLNEFVDVAKHALASCEHPEHEDQP